ncbi:amidase signature enzyme [Mytilinidion resinicola]|uniref:Amidase signature enzyme n=1 Tax=Mytilinidion resinicola TaxID=574789 RepID=A0A6A6Y635_9PEZI|nr:amidase signature enzyme [Mytilinidion resinicola]KAF2804286.1 amidase signature enzyme [Mytilinidion resinicola]
MCEKPFTGRLGNQTALLTVFAVTPGDVVDTASLRARIAQYTETDDVFHPRFLAGIIFQGAEKSQLHVKLEPTDAFREWGLEWMHFQSSAKDSAPLPPGPYMVRDGELFQVWRLYSDNNLAFIQSVWPTIGSSGEYTQVSFAGNGYRTLAIATPSRLYTSWPERLPLDGVRIGIKDLYHLKGLRTSLCNRAFNELYPPQSTTAKTIVHLISKGVQVVGKNHLSSFALEEHPTQSIDYESPFNPRADGYQITGGSSSGSASAVASYDWLDFAIATDGKHLPRPLWNGCFGLRPSTNAISTEGVVSVYPGFDTPGLLGRDLEKFHHFVSVWYGQETGNTPISAPKLLIPTDFFTGINSDQSRLINNFVKDLERSSGTVAERRSIAETWSHSAPVDEPDLSVYLQNATLCSFYYTAFHVFDDFRTSYEKEFGRKPFVTETNRWLWKLGEQVSREQYEDMNRRLSIFKQWFLKHYMKAGEQNSILVLPLSDVKPNYRDVYPGANSTPRTGLRPTYLSAYLGAPELALPIGHIEYMSRISGNAESLPVAVSLMGPPGTDLALIQLTVDSLKQANRPTTVRAGTARMWDHTDSNNSIQA